MHSHLKKRIYFGPKKVSKKEILEGREKWGKKPDFPSKSKASRCIPLNLRRNAGGA
jgi:hypothetical protein